MPRKNKNKQNKGGGKKQAQVMKVSGKGAYGLDTMKSIGGKIKQMAKAALKSERVQNGIMSGAGTLAERLIPGSGQSAKTVAKLLLNRINGSGDYETGGDPTVNSLFKMNKQGEMTGGNALTIPKFDSSSNGVHVAHREYVMDFIAPDNPDQFNIMNLVINPGDATVFPWLSNIAVDFQQYRFLGLVIEFISTTSPYNTSPAMGFIAMSAQYNVLQEPYGSMIELENSSESIFCRPDRCIMYGVECKKQSYNMYYIRNPASVVIDPATYDFASIYIATQGLPATFTPGSVLGQIWISYHLELIEPIYTLPYGGSFLVTATATAQDSISATDFLFPLMPENIAYINYTGRFTPKSLDGTSQPILSAAQGLYTVNTTYGGVTDPNATIVYFRPYNLAAGQGMLCTLTIQFPANGSTQAIQSFTGNKYLCMTPAISIVELIDCQVLPWDDGAFLTDVPASSLLCSNLASTSLVPTTSLSIKATSTFLGCYTISWYVAVTGAYPSFSFAAMSDQYNLAGNPLYGAYGFSSIAQQVTTSFSAVAIKYTDTAGLPKYVPYTVPAVVAPSRTPTRLQGSMSFHDQHIADGRKAAEEKRLLSELIRKHGLSIARDGHVVSALESKEQEGQEDDPSDYVMPPQLTRTSSVSGKKSSL